PRSRVAAVGLEVEIALLMKADLAGPGVTAVSALLAVEGAMPAFELIDYRISGKPRASDVIADGVLANAIVLGRPVVPVTGLDLSLEGGGTGGTAGRAPPPPRPGSLANRPTRRAG